MARKHSPKRPDRQRRTRYAKLRGRGNSRRNAAEKAGYSKKRATRTAYDLEKDPRILMQIAEELRKDMDEKEVRGILAAQARGQVPTKVVRGSSARVEFDTAKAAENTARTLGMFKDHTRIDFAADPDAAIAEVQSLLATFGMTVSPEEIKKVLGESASA